MTENKTKSDKNHKQEVVERGYSEELTEHLQRKYSEFTDCLRLQFSHIDWKRFLLGLKLMRPTFQCFV